MNLDSDKKNDTNKADNSFRNEYSKSAWVVLSRGEYNDLLLILNERSDKKSEIALDLDYMI